eukprot:CAMPEP_0117516072 /NCGR_PEP_ID=MMETSP0784-20121206/30906_1 /TAXON_ID=39447 /ORGANISM="" /LENGTH=374 /DNA_ID=CAMNT_0005311907 /DNA_START=41 /DNA_END=1165 /DNA_ORIENTATION=+
MVRLTDKARYFEDKTGSKTVNQYRLRSEVGRGTYSKVKWAEDDAGGYYAMKVFSKAVLERRQVAHFDADGASTISLQERIAEELRILSSLSNPGVMALLEVIDDPGHDKLYVVLEGLIGGQLMHWCPDAIAYKVRSDPSAVRQHWGEHVRVTALPRPASQTVVAVYREPVAQFFLRQLLEALVYLHKQGVIHKDLKPDNILLSQPAPSDDPRFVRLLALDMWPAVTESALAVAPEAPAVGGDLVALLERSGLQTKIGDFNTSAVCEDPDCLIYDAEGTLQFTPPECFEEKSNGIKGKPRDVWALGCVLFTMLFGRCPYWAEENIILQLSIMQDALVLPSGSLSAQAEGLLRGLMERDTAKRLSAVTALQSDWLR